MVKDNADLSPEKQLLKLIEEPHDRVAQKAALRGKGVSLFSWGALRGRWAFSREKLTASLKSLSGPLDIRKINGLLTFFTVLVGIYFVISSVLLAWHMSVVPGFSFKGESTVKIEALKQASQLKAINFYLEKSRSRDIFKIGKQSSEESAPPQETSKAEQESITNKYKLVGISWSDNPDVMIEDTQAQKTYFLKRGQSIDSVKLQAIFKDKVVLSYRGQEIELR